MHFGWFDNKITDLNYVNFFFSDFKVTPLLNKKKTLGFNSSYFVGNVFQYSNSKKIYDICFISRLTKQKRILDFLLKIKPIFQKKKNLKIIMVLPDEDINFNFSKYKNFKNDFFKIFTHQERRQFDIITSKYNAPMSLDENLISKIYNMSKIFVHNSVIEGNPRTVVEALCCGLPSIIPVPSELGNFPKNTSELYKYNLNKKNSFEKIIMKLLFKKINFKKNSHQNMKLYSNIENSKKLKKKLLKNLGHKYTSQVKSFLNLNLNRVLPGHTKFIDRKYIKKEEHDDLNSLVGAYFFFKSIDFQMGFFLLCKCFVFDQIKFFSQLTLNLIKIPFHFYKNYRELV